MADLTARVSVILTRILSVMEMILYGYVLWKFDLTKWSRVLLFLLLLSRLWAWIKFLTRKSEKGKLYKRLRKDFQELEENLPKFKPFQSKTRMNAAIWGLVLVSVGIRTLVPFVIISGGIK